MPTIPQSTPTPSLLDSLITLKSQYERSLSEAETQASHLREQLSHVNVLLLNQLVPIEAPIKSAEPTLTLEEADALVERLALAPAATEAPVSDTPKPKTSTRKIKAAPEPTPESGKRAPRPLLPAYAGLTRVEAIAQVLTAASGEVLHQDTIIKSLYGDLSPEELKDERVRIKTALLTGVKDQKWQKASAPSSYFIKATATKPKRPGRKPEPSKEPKSEPVAEVVEAIIPAATAESAPGAAKPRTSLTLLPAFEGLSKREAIAQVLEQYSGEALHQDTIIQRLYGDLSIADLKAERSRMDTALRTGVKDQKWQKASVPASYVMTAAAEAPTTKAPAAKPKSERKTALGKAKASKKKVRPKRSELELVALLRKADIQV